jgi:hypothetical protein
MMAGILRCALILTVSIPLCLQNFIFEKFLGLLIVIRPEQTELNKLEAGPSERPSWQSSSETSPWSNLFSQKP